MVRPTPDSIETFMGITGASQSLAVRKLEEYGGNLDRAVNAYFIELEGSNRSSAASPQNNFVDTRNQLQSGRPGILPFLSAARSFRPSLLLDPNYRRNLYSQIGASVFPSSGPQLSPNGEFSSGYQQPYHPGPRLIGGVSGTSLPSGDSQIHGSSMRDAESHPYGNDVDEEMFQRAIEASNQERQLHQEDDELAHALSLSLKTAEQEKVMLEKTLEFHGSSGRAETINYDREKALFGEIPEETLLRCGPRQPGVPDKSIGLDHLPRPSPSPSHVARQLLNQQDDEHLAYLLADGKNEVGVSSGADISCSELGESQTKMLEGEEFERLLAAKAVSLPKEPALDDKNAVTLVVRMPDGNRRGRRFLISDKLQLLLDFIDIGRAVKPGTYRVVRPYPRHTFSVRDISLSLKELVRPTNRKHCFWN